jgi:cytochrome c oxidase subunit 2
VPAVLVAVLGTLTLAPAAFADFISPESGGSPNADSIDRLYWVLFALSCVVFIGVEGALIYSLFKFRARKGAVAAQIRGNTRLEIGWTVGAAVILLILGTITFIKLDDIRNPPNSSANGLQLAQGVSNAEKNLPPNGKSFNVCVNGQQYVWRYTYSQQCSDDAKAQAFASTAFSYEEMVVPTETTVTLDIQAQDVAHSWWIPELGGKFDAIPGYTSHTWFKVPAKLAGKVFRGQCAELCGRGHANMTAQVRALAPAEFERWLARQKAAIKEANTAAEQQRKSFDAEDDPAAPAGRGTNPADPGSNPTETP